MGLILLRSASRTFLNLSLLTGVFPKSMQMADVSASNKSGDRNDMSNYRPISVFPVFSKGLEKIIHVRLNIVCEKHAIFTDSQFGFRKGHTTKLPTALLQQK